jgi:hypothetical protein
MTLPNERIRAMQKLIELAERMGGMKVAEIKYFASRIRDQARRALRHAPTADSFEDYFKHKD